MINRERHLAGHWETWVLVSLVSSVYGNGHKIPVGLSPLPSFKDGHDELISANSRTSVVQEALFPDGVAEVVGS